MSRIKAYLISLFVVIGAGSCVWASFNYETFGRISSVILFVLMMLGIIAFLGEALRNYANGEGQ